MNQKQEHNQAESIKDAAIGYTAVVLGIICFIVALAVLAVAVRFVAGLGASTNTATTATQTTTTLGARP